ncbi:MAG: monofunctional biosynthetic peptidoglycan transglycosylase [Flavobacteriales bacterium]|nr:monofunctional biosynthetic peptidoglycan transglycosylase [Flavobacteriales bacterium]
MLRLLRRIWKIFRWVAIRFIIFSVAWVLLYKWMNPPITALQIWQGSEKEGEWVDLEEMSYQLPLAAIAAEDQRFPTHWGFDTEAIAAAIEYNKTHERTIGASTISQQTAKNVFLWPSRTWVRKGLEVWFTALIEIFWSKERIMEVYLNVIETGPQCFGVDAAAQHYFGKSCTDVSRRQASLMVSAFPQPRRSNPGKPSSYLSNRAYKVEKQMRLLGGKNYLPWSKEE